MKGDEIDVNDEKQPIFKSKGELSDLDLQLRMLVLYFHCWLYWL